MATKPFVVLLSMSMSTNWLLRVLGAKESSGGPVTQEEIHAKIEDQPLQQPLYVPETLTGMELQVSFRESDVHIAFVTDQYGEVHGIVALQDLVEAITGEFQPRTPTRLERVSATTAAGCSTAKFRHMN